MAEHNAYDTDSQRLEGLVREQLGTGKVFAAHEVGAILRHQLAAPVAFDLGALEVVEAQRVRLITDAQGLLLRSFADLFGHAHPPLKLLELTKQFAKAHMSDPQSPLPQDVARVLYILSILTARRKCQAVITTQDDASIRAHARDILGQAWLDEATRAMLQEGLTALEA